MADIEFATGDAQAVKRWSADLAKETFDKMWLRRFVGTGEDACIVKRNELESAPGDEIKYDFNPQDRTAGIQGDSEAEGFESDLAWHPDSVKIDQLRKVYSFRRMSQQRTMHNLRGVIRGQTSNWFARSMDGMWLSYLCGTTGNDIESEGIWEEMGGTDGIAVAADSGFAGNALTAPDANHFYNKGSGNSFALSDLNLLKTMAKRRNPRIRPIMVDGQPKYVAILNELQVKALQDDTGDGSWENIQLNAAKRGDSNPIYRGALGEYNNIVLHESELLPRLLSANDGYSRYSAPSGSAFDGMTFGVFLGAGASTFAMGNAYDKMDQSAKKGGGYFAWVEGHGDYKNKKGIGGAACFGLKTQVFNSEFFGAIPFATDETTI